MLSIKPRVQKLQQYFSPNFILLENNNTNVSFCPTELKLYEKTILRNAGTNGCGDAVSRKPPMGRRDTSTPPPAPLAGVVVPRSQVCLSTFYKECAESADFEPDCGCQPAERDGRSVSGDGKSPQNCLKRTLMNF